MSSNKDNDYTSAVSVQLADPTNKSQLAVQTPSNHSTSSSLSSPLSASFSSHSLKKKFTVSILRSLSRRRDYVLVLDLLGSTFSAHKLRQGEEVKRTFPIASCVKLDKNPRDSLSLGVTFGHEPNEWKRQIFFTNPAERELFCDCVHAMIVSGKQAYQSYKTHNFPLETEQNIDEYCKFLIQFSAAQSKLDNETISNANGSGKNDSNPNSPSVSADNSLRVAKTPTASENLISQIFDASQTNFSDQFGFSLLGGEIIIVAKSASRIDILSDSDALNARSEKVNHNNANFASNSSNSAEATGNLANNDTISGESGTSHAGGNVTSSRGTLFLSNYRIIYRDNNTPREIHPLLQQNQQNLSTFGANFGGNASNCWQYDWINCEMPVGTIFRVIKQDKTSNSVRILGKDSRKLEFIFFEEKNKVANSGWVEGLVQQISRLAFPGQDLALFASLYQLPLKNQALNGWNLYDSRWDYERIGLLDNKNYRLSTVNHNFTVCPSYPPQFVVPAAFDDTDVVNLAHYRSQARIPVIIWLHPATKATLTRCAQPLTGLKGKRSDVDEKLFGFLRLSTPNSAVLHIIDARPYKAAMGNTIMGKGTENMANYTQCALEFQNIDNIHAIRGAHEKLIEAVENRGESNWLSRLEASQWLVYVRLVLVAAVRMAELMTFEGLSCVCHCSDGWDRTSQLTALVELMLDPYYRTLEGFACLIEKEWLSLGHHFSERHGVASENYTDDQRAPIFLQFLDCVFQLLHQFPCSFQFNEYFLIDLYDSMLSCRFGTFLFDNLRLRIENNLAKTTVSVWTWLLAEENRPKYYNINYIKPPTAPNSSTEAPNNTRTYGREKFLFSPANYCVPSTAPKRLLLWENMFLRWDKPHNLGQQQQLQQRTAEILQLQQRIDGLLRSLSAVNLNSQQIQEEIPLIRPDTKKASALSPDNKKPSEVMLRQREAGNDDIINRYARAIYKLNSPVNKTLDNSALFKGSNNEQKHHNPVNPVMISSPPAVSSPAQTHAHGFSPSSEIANSNINPALDFNSNNINTDESDSEQEANGQQPPPPSGPPPED
jgi:myotubularin-related protein 1/2